MRSRTARPCCSCRTRLPRSTPWSSDSPPSASARALAAGAAGVGPVASHPWRGSTLASWPPDGHDRAVAALDEAAAAAAELAGALGDVEQLVPGAVGRTRAQLIALGHLAGLA